MSSISQINSLSLKNHLRIFWNKDETILYVGRTTKRKKYPGLGNRLHEFYGHRIGNRSPHSGGQWILTLDNPSDLYIFWHTTDNLNLENGILEFFYRQVTKLPFGNLQYFNNGRRVIKSHGLKYQRWYI
jgi:hypothetical protein